MCSSSTMSNGRLRIERKEWDRRMRVLLVGLLVLTCIAAQAQAPAGSLSFEVASVKPNKSGETSGGITIRPGGRYIATNVPLRALIRSAYGPIHDGQIVGRSRLDEH